MMKKPRFLLIIMAVFSLVLMSGCVSLIEDITVLEDGSGTMRFSIGVESEQYEAFQDGIPEGFELENLFTAFTRDENVLSIVFDSYESNGFTWDTVELEIADFTTAFGQARRIGPITITFDQQAGEYRFTQTIDVGNSPLSIPGINLMDLSAATYVVNLTSPQIVSTNGVQPASGFSTWSIPLDEVFQGGSTVFLRANYVLEPYEGLFIPWEVFFPYVVIGFLGLGGISILIVILVNTAGRREKQQTLKFK
jgi:hypothetical protein